MQTVSMSKKVLIFAPLGAWMVHHQLDAVVGAALQLRGCDVRVLCCDGLFDKCYIAGNPFNPATCAGCARASAQLFSAVGLNIVQLRSLVSTAEIQAAKDWAKSLPRDGFPEATHEGAKLGLWMAHAMHAFYKTARLDFSRDDVVEMGRSLLANGVLIQRGLARLGQTFRPDHVLCYHGANAYYRVCLELCRAEGIEVFLHERGFTDDTFQFLRNRSIYAMGALPFEEWSKYWRDAPLNEKQFGAVKQMAIDRELGKNVNFQRMHNYTSNATSIRRVLRIPPEAPILALFATGDWEFGMYQSFMGKAMPLGNQEEWIQRTADACAKAGWYLVIRHHPLGAGTPKYARASDFLGEIFKINRGFGGHVRVIMPAEQTSSYDLIWNSNAVVTALSTVGMEALLRGTPTAWATQFMFRPYGTEWASDPRLYPELLASAMRRTDDFSLAELREAFRYAHFLSFVVSSNQFKSFGIKNIYEPDIRIRGAEDLAPGQDTTMDRLCDHIIKGTPVYELPDPAARAEEEAKWLQRELDASRERRAGVRQFLRENPAAPDPLITVLRVRRNGCDQFGETFLGQSLRRARHQKIATAQVAYPTDATPGALLAALADAVDHAEGEFIYVATDETDIGESALSSAIDALGEPAQGECDGVVFGAYACDVNGRLTDEIFTALYEAPAFAEATRRIPPLKEPAQLLALAVWRVAGLRRWLAQRDASSFATAEELAAFWYEKLFGGGAALHSQRMPAVTIYAQRTPQELLEHGVEALKGGHAAESLRLLDQAKALGASARGLDHARGVAKAKLGRLPEALWSVEAELTRQPEQPEAWQLLRLLMPHVLHGRIGYAAVASVVESADDSLSSTEAEFLFNLIQGLPLDGLIANVGHLSGRASLAIASACAGTARRLVAARSVTVESKRNGFAPDVWLGRLRRFDLDGYATLLDGSALVGPDWWGNRPPADFALIEVAGDFEAIAQTLERIYTVVKVGGWIVLKGVEPSNAGPARAWEQIGSRLLADHQRRGALAGGRKQAGRPFESFAR